MKLEVGQKLWWVPNRGDAREISVAKVGRRWATLDNGNRVDMLTDHGSGDIPNEKERWGGEWGKLYLSLTHCESVRARDHLLSAWRTFQDEIRKWSSHNPPSTLEDIMVTASRWGIKLEKEGSTT